MLVNASSQTMLPTFWGHTFYKKVLLGGVEEYFWTMEHYPARLVNIDEGLRV